MSEWLTIGGWRCERPRQRPWPSQTEDEPSDHRAHLLDPPCAQHPECCIDLMTSVMPEQVVDPMALAGRLWLRRRGIGKKALHLGDVQFAGLRTTTGFPNWLETTASCGTPALGAPIPWRTGQLPRLRQDSAPRGFRQSRPCPFAVRRALVPHEARWAKQSQPGRPGHPDKLSSKWMPALSNFQARANLKA